MPAFVVKATWPAPTGELLVDVDGDGTKELVRGHPFLLVTQGPALSYRRVLGNGASVQPPPFHAVGSAATSVPVTYHYAIAAADVDRDGHVDIFVSRGESVTPAPWPDQLWMGDGQGGFVESAGRLPSAPTPPVQNVNQSAVFCDLDRDGDQDLLLCSDPQVLVYENDGSGHFTDATAARIIGSVWARCLLVLDADRVGDLDVVAGGTSTVLLQNDGTGVLHPVVQSTVGWCQDLFAVDMDGDGHDDVLAIYSSQQQVYLATRNSSVLVQAPHLLPNQGVNWASWSNAVVDFDGDGDLDFFLGSNPLACRLWENTGQGMVDVTHRLPLGSPVSEPFAADHDLDGDLDLLVGVTPGAGQQIVYSSTIREAVTTAPPVRGTAYTVDFYAQGGHVMLVALGLGEANVLLPGLGRVYLDPALAVYLGALGYASWTRQPYGVPIPNLPSLVGLKVGMQGLDIDLRTGAMQTTNCPFEFVQ